MRAAVVVALILASGCVGSDSKPAPTPSPGFAPQPLNETYYLKAGQRLSLDPPTKATPDKVAATPMANGFANEDIRGFVSDPAAVQRTFLAARIVAYYEVQGPTVDPFVSTANPQQPPRALVFWLGSHRIYPSSLSTPGAPVLVPGQVYRAEADFVLPPGGWLVPANETLSLIVATLAVNAQGYELRFLVDSSTTPSRLELRGATQNVPLPRTLFGQASDYTIPGNSGMFTGATAERVDSRIRIPVAVRANDTYVEARVVFRSNQGGKSDLDFTLFAPDGRRTLLSTTPYQNETIRAFVPQLVELGHGNYTAEIQAYSGVNTRLSLQVFYGSPR